MADETRYVIDTDIRFGPLERFDVTALEKACPHDRFNTSLCRVNDCIVRLGVLHGSFRWHQHEAQDELFVVVSGRLLVDLEVRTVELGPQQGMVVPRGVQHRPRAAERTVLLMVEGATVTPTDDQAGTGGG